ncbi:MAG: hypothetical protein ACJ75C_13815, partial [Actinomycetes bacterium]
MTRPPLLLRPALAAADRMRTSLRLGALVLALAVPGIVTTWAYTAEVNATIAFSAAERDGTDVVEPALLALADTVAGKTPDLAAVRDAMDAHPELDLESTVPDGAGPAALAALITEVG